MKVVNAEVHGWAKLRTVTFRRDLGCVAVQPRIFGEGIARDQCRDGMRNLIRWDDLFRLEWDHVKEQLAAGKRPPNDEAHGVMVCAWHHRLSTQWRTDTTEHRQVLRRYLADHYPDVWAEWLANFATPLP